MFTTNAFCYNSPPNTCMAASGHPQSAHMVASMQAQMNLQPEASQLPQLEAAQDTGIVADLYRIIERQSQEIATLSNSRNNSSRYILWGYVG